MLSRLVITFLPRSKLIIGNWMPILHNGVMFRAKKQSPSNALCSRSCPSLNYHSAKYCGQCVDRGIGWRAEWKRRRFEELDSDGQVGSRLGWGGVDKPRSL